MPNFRFLWVVALFQITESTSTSIKGMTYIGHFKGVGNLRSRSFQEFDYYVSNNAAPWSNADNDCRSVFGKNAGLISMDSIDERNAINLMLEDYGYGILYWTSGIYDPSNALWRWASNNDPIPIWAPWENGYPLPNPNSVQRIAMFYQNRYSANWRTLSNTQLQRYICEVGRTPEVTTATISPTTTTIMQTTIRDPDPVSNISSCGQVFTAKSGQIRYISDKPFGPDEVCVWMLSSTERTIFIINLIEASFAEQQSIFLSSFDYGPINGYNGHQRSYPIMYPGQQTTLHGNVVIITFSAYRNTPTEGRSFLLEYKLYDATEMGDPDPDASLNSLHAIYGHDAINLKYPVQHTLYDNRELTVLAFAPPNGVLDPEKKTSTLQIDMKNSDCCCNDAVKIYYFDFTAGGLVDQFLTICNDRIYNRTFQLERMYVLLFLSDDNNVGEGFHATYDLGRP